MPVGAWCHPLARQAQLENTMTSCGHDSPRGQRSAYPRALAESGTEILCSSYVENAINLTGLPVSSLWSLGQGWNPLLPQQTVGHEGVCDGADVTLLLLQTPSKVN